MILNISNVLIYWMKLDSDLKVIISSRYVILKIWLKYLLNEMFSSKWKKIRIYKSGSYKNKQSTHLFISIVFFIMLFCFIMCYDWLEYLWKNSGMKSSSTASFVQKKLQNSIKFFCIPGR